MTPDEEQFRETWGSWFRLIKRNFDHETELYLLGTQKTLIAKIWFFLIPFLFSVSFYVFCYTPSSFLYTFFVRDLSKSEIRKLNIKQKIVYFPLTLIKFIIFLLFCIISFVFSFGLILSIYLIIGYFIYNAL